MATTHSITLTDNDGDQVELTWEVDEIKAEISIKDYVVELEEADLDELWRWAQRVHVLVRAAARRKDVQT